ncbi:SpvB/TcaC N-terminal domain-containing protein [Streptomyces sp. NPDC051940]|uniref:SpvB/TcaC N-terminal domain-containing protein n=1 Tax=Streptomyces sp. NPDC051940 TaxID=3155675 RepID=UPI00341BF75C
MTGRIWAWRKWRTLPLLLGLALLLSLLSGSGWQPRTEPVASVWPAGSCIPGEPAPEDAPAPAAALAERTVSPDDRQSTVLKNQGAEVRITPAAVKSPTAIGVQPLSGRELPTLGAGMANVTRGPEGYRFTPTPHLFTDALEVSLPYDEAALRAAGMTPQDVRTYYFDVLESCWRTLELLRIDEENELVVSRTDHFTDMVNATVVAPETPDQVSFDANAIKGIQAADPGSGVNMIAPPSATQRGDASLSYPLTLPGGRAGMQPSLALAYSSAADSTWAGTGWDLAVPSIGVDTRWGVPRYDTATETETYLMGGEQLTPVAHRGAPKPRTENKVFRSRVEGGFARIERRGDSPRTYSWVVTDKKGVRWFYGGEGAVLTDDAGNVFSWALRETRDLTGNTVRYRYAVVEDAGVRGGTVAGRNLYVKEIAYTGHGDQDGPYKVTFVRDRDLSEPRREDVGIDARGGFKRVTADLLRRVEVRLNGTPVRRYDLGYTTGAFSKTLLASVTQRDAEAQVVGTHEFDYFDDIRDASGAYDAFARVGWDSPDDGVRNSLVDGVRSGAGKASAIGGHTSTGVGGHLYVGFGTSRTKTNSIGVKAGFNSSSDEGLLALVDLDADSLPDKVFKDGDTYVFRKNLSRPGGEPRFAATKTEVTSLPGLDAESASTRTVGVEGYLGAIAAQIDHVDTFTTSDRYFTDVNGDGIVDLVNGESVLFGRVGADGTPVFGGVQDTPAPIDSGQVDGSGILPDFGADRERRIESSPLVDSVRRWTAPYDGTVRITGAVTLPAAQGEREQFTDPDGVRVAVQHEDTELWSARIEESDRTAHTPQNVDAIQVRRGEDLYFRVGSVFDGSADAVSWDPEITYTGFEAVDANGLPLHSYTASEDFTLAGRRGTVTVPLAGTLHLTGDVTLKRALTDDVTVRITKAGDPVLERTLRAGAPGTVDVDLNVDVTEDQELSWRITTDSAVDVTALEWTPRAEYTGTAGPTGPAADDDRFAPAFFAPYDIDTYPADRGTAPVTPYTATADGTLTVTPALSAQAGATGTAVFTVKKHGALLAKRTVNLGTDPEPVQVAVTAGEELYFDFAVADPELAEKITGGTATVGGGEEITAAVHRAVAEGVAGRPYRGWTMTGYNGNRDRATQPIRQSDLTGESIRDTLPQSVDPEQDADEFAADPRITAPDVIPYLPDTEHRRWGSGEFTWVAAAQSSSSRYGGQSLGLPTAADVASGQAVPRMSRSRQLSLTGGLSGDIGTLGGSIASGTSQGVLDYLDMNGDGYPDVVGSGGIQYTGPTGALGATRTDVPDGAVRESENRTGNASAGSAARTITTGKGHGAPPGWGSADTATSGNDMPPLGVGGSLGSGTSEGEFDLVDINGDGLPDRVYDDGRAALNLGYRFAAPEPWPGGRLNQGASSSSGVNIGFNTDFYGFAGGASFDQSDANTKNSLMDVNGDGLLDRVATGDPIKVALNTGNGFADFVPFNGSLSGVNAGRNAKLGGGVYFRISFCAFLVTGCLIVNPGASVSTGASAEQQTLRDINGDGFADHLASDSDGQLTVAANRTGRTNLLKSVTRPLGSRFDLAYAEAGNTYDQPGHQWVMSQVKIDDGLTGDGPSVQTHTYRYENGVYDRLNREFLGYGKVVTQDRDTDSTVYRTAERTYDTSGYHTRGLLTRETVADGAGRRFTETVHTYESRSLGSDSVFPMLVRTDRRWFEGQDQPGKQTRVDRAYDDAGNLSREIDYGDVGDADDTDTAIGYSDCADTHVLGVPDAIEVRGGGTVMRSRDSAVDCATGLVTRHRALAADGTASVTDLTYHDTGTIASVTGPANHRGQRFQLSYGYDDTTGTYTVQTRDSFGYVSTSAYDLRFGVPTRVTDVNNQELRTTYDAVGRVTSVTGPHDLGAGRPTIAFSYHPQASVPYAVTRHLDRTAAGTVRADTIDTVTFTDGLGRVVQTKKDARVGGQDVMTVSGRTVYDAFGRAAQQYYPTTEAKGPANEELSTGFDAVAPTALTHDVLDRTIRTRLPDGTESATGYGFGADRAGDRRFEVVTTDAKGIATRTFNDVRQQTTAVLEPGAKTGDQGAWTSYGYDALGMLTRVTDDKNNVTTSSYDNLGRRVETVSPDAGRTTTTYDPADNVVRKVTGNLAAAGQAVTYTYDHNRLTDITYPVFTGNAVHYTYGDPGASDNAAGRITVIKDAAGEVRRGYGPLGETVRESRTLPGPGPQIRTFTTGYDYDSLGRLLKLSYPDGEVLSYAYDSGGHVTAATGVKGGYTYDYVDQVDYDKFEQRTAVALGNGTRTSYTYDAEDRRLATVNSTLPTGYTFQNVSYDYDEVGNLTELTNDTQRPDSANTPKLGGPSTQTFGYDNLHRLTEASGSYAFAADKTDAYTVSTSYDSIHNITGKSQRHAITVGADTGGDPGTVQEQQRTTYTNAYAYGSRPHAPSQVGTLALTYDRNGNQTDSVSSEPGNPRRQQIWDEDNRLACVFDTAKNSTQPQEPAACNQPGQPPSVRFTYDDRGNRVVKDGSQTTLYPNQFYTARNSNEFKHVFIGTTRVATQWSKPGGAYEKDQFFFHGDTLGSTSFGTDVNGQLAEHLNYFPSGETWVDEHPGTKNPFQFSGKENDQETGYYYHGARYYDPRSGVWESSDPALGSYLDGSFNGGATKPPNLQLYGYAYNNPARYTDPTGLGSEDQPFNLGNHLRETYTLNHDQALLMVGSYLQSIHPGARVTYDLQTMTGGRDPQNVLPSGERIDLILWTNTGIFVWDAKHLGGGAEAAGPGEVKSYVSQLQAARLAARDPRPVLTGSEIPELRAPSQQNPSATLRVRSSESFPNTGVITYTTAAQQPVPLPVPMTSPRSDPTPYTAPTTQQQQALGAAAILGTTLLFLLWLVAG